MQLDFYIIGFFASAAISFGVGVAIATVLWEAAIWMTMYHFDEVENVR